MRKEIYEIFIDTLQGKYTIEELYDYWKDFCKENVLPCSSIGVFREKIEPVLLEQKHIIEYTNKIKIKSITIKKT